MNIPVPTLSVVAVMGLIGIGLYALLISRNLIKLVVALQLLVKGAMLALVLAGRINGQIALGESMAVTVIVADTIVAVIALALIVQVRRHFGSIDVKALTTLRR